MNKPKILIWDIETSLAIVTTFQLKTEYIPHTGIIQDWHIICGSYKWLGESKVYSAIAKNDCEVDMLLELREKVIEADIIVHHNGDKFDIKKLNTRLIYYGLDPLPNKPITCDTLKEAKATFSFMSNRLDYLGKYLGVGKKVHNYPGLWMEELNGDSITRKKAIDKLVKYCEGDVRLLEKVYLKMKPYIRHPNLTVFNKDFKDRPACNNCASKNMIKAKPRLCAVGLKQQYQCKSCGHYTTDRKLIKRGV